MKIKKIKHMHRCLPFQKKKKKKKDYLVFLVRYYCDNIKINSFFDNKLEFLQSCHKIIHHFFFLFKSSMTSFTTPPKKTEEKVFNDFSFTSCFKCNALCMGIVSNKHFLFFSFSFGATHEFIFYKYK